MWKGMGTISSFIHSKRMFRDAENIMQQPRWIFSLPVLARWRYYPNWMFFKIHYLMICVQIRGVEKG